MQNDDSKRKRGLGSVGKKVQQKRRAHALQSEERECRKINNDRSSDSPVIVVGEKRSCMG